MKRLLIFCIIIACLLTSCTKYSMWEDTYWYGADLRLHFDYLSGITMETSNGHSYSYPKWEGTYSPYIGSDVTISFNEYWEKMGKRTYVSGMSITATRKANTLTFHWDGKDWVFTKMKK